MLLAALPTKDLISRQAPNETYILREFRRESAHETACIQKWVLKVLQAVQANQLINTWGRLNSTLACNNNGKDVIDVLNYYGLTTTAIIDVKVAYNVVASLILEEMHDKATTIVIALSIEKETDNCVLQLLITTTFKSYTNE